MPAVMPAAMLMAMSKALRAINGMVLASVPGLEPGLGNLPSAQLSPADPSAAPAPEDSTRR